MRGPISGDTLIEPPLEPWWAGGWALAGREQRHIVEVSLPEPTPPQCHRWLLTGAPSEPSVNRGLSLGHSTFFAFQKVASQTATVFLSPSGRAEPAAPRDAEHCQGYMLI